jgi:hypothetical protein
MKDKIKLFTDYVYEYQKILGLLDWEIYVFETKRENTMFRAEWDFRGRKATIFYHLGWVTKLSDKDIKRGVIHELLEISLSRIRDHLQPYYSERTVNELIHQQIIIILNLYLGNIIEYTK